jgi:2-keto-3-deoxy-L-rhamnonate aldolase RhmA
MRENRVKKVMREGKLALGTYVTFADPQVVEIIGLAGFDAAFIDMEHTTFDLDLITEMVRAADLAGVTSVARVPDNDEKLILRLLDAGAEGIIIPHVDGLEGAKRAVEAVRYAPLGHRGGAGGTRATRFGTVSWEDHVKQSNEQVLLSVMTEDERGIRDIEKIAALEGVAWYPLALPTFPSTWASGIPAARCCGTKSRSWPIRLKALAKPRCNSP